MKKFTKYNNDDLKIVAHEFHQQGEFDSYNRAYDTLCADYAKDGLSDKWLDFFFEKSAKGPVTVLRSPEGVYNVMTGERAYVLAQLADLDMKKVKFKAERRER